MSQNAPNLPSLSRFLFFSSTLALALLTYLHRLFNIFYVGRKFELASRTKGDNDHIFRVCAYWMLRRNTIPGVMGRQIGEDLGDEIGRRIGEEIGRELGEEIGDQTVVKRWFHPTPMKRFSGNPKNIRKERLDYHRPSHPN